MSLLVLNGEGDSGRSDNAEGIPNSRHLCDFDAAGRIGRDGIRYR